MEGGYRIGRRQLLRGGLEWIAGATLVIDNLPQLLSASAIRKVIGYEARIELAEQGVTQPTQEATEALTEKKMDQEGVSTPHLVYNGVKTGVGMVLFSTGMHEVLSSPAGK